MNYPLTFIRMILMLVSSVIATTALGGPLDNQPVPQEDINGAMIGVNSITITSPEKSLLKEIHEKIMEVAGVQTLPQLEQKFIGCRKCDKLDDPAEPVTLIEYAFFIEHKESYKLIQGVLTEFVTNGKLFTYEFKMVRDGGACPIPVPAGCKTVGVCNNVSGCTKWPLPAAGCTKCQ